MDSNQLLTNLEEAIPRSGILVVQSRIPLHALHSDGTTPLAMFSKFLASFIFASIALNAAPKKELSILLYGKTGSGKSTLINVIYNHMMNRRFEDPRDIIIPLMVHGKTLEVNVDEFKHGNITLNPDMRSQTNQIRSYTFENDESILTIWDTPGFIDTRGSEAEIENRTRLAQFLIQARINNIAIVLAPSDVVRVRPEHQNGIDELCRLLPASFSTNVIGLYNFFLSTSPDAQEYHQKKLSILLNSNEPPSTFFINGSSFFDSFNKLTEQQKFISTMTWTMDRKEVDRLLLETRNTSLLNQDEVKKIQLLQSTIQSALDELSRLFQLVEFQNSNLKLLEAKKGDFLGKIALCKAEIETLETERTARIQELVGWQTELKALAMKTDEVDAYVAYLSRLLSSLNPDPTVSKSELARQDQVRNDWVGIYKNSINV